MQFRFHLNKDLSLFGFAQRVVELLLGQSRRSQQGAAKDATTHKTQPAQDPALKDRSLTTSVGMLDVLHGYAGLYPALPCTPTPCTLNTSSPPLHTPLAPHGLEELGWVGGWVGGLGFGV